MAMSARATGLGVFNLTVTVSGPVGVALAIDGIWVAEARLGSTACMMLHATSVAVRAAPLENLTPLRMWYTSVLGLGRPTEVARTGVY